MNHQITVVATGIFGAFAASFAYMFHFYPLLVLLGAIAVVGYVAATPPGGRKKAPPKEPWYMK
jgi:hypothetical protein